MTDDDTPNTGEEIINRRDLLRMTSSVLRCEAGRLTRERYRPTESENLRIAHLRAFVDLAQVHSSILAGGPVRGRVGTENLEGTRIIFEDVERAKDPLDIHTQNAIANRDGSPSVEGGETSQNIPSAKVSSAGESTDPQNSENFRVDRNDDFMHNPRRDSGRGSSHDGRGIGHTGLHPETGPDPGRVPLPAIAPAPSHREGEGTTSFPIPEKTIQGPPPYVIKDGLTAKQKRTSEDERNRPIISW